MSIEAASVFRMRLGIAQTDLGDWTVLQEDLFRPLVPVTIRVGVGRDPDPGGADQRLRGHGRT